MRILIADDESIIRLGLKGMLAEEGHEVVAAVNGREAIQMARRHRPDLAILDIKMPFTDGLAAAKAIVKERPLPIILLTAFSEGDLVEKASDLPIQGYLVKPVEAGALRAAIAVARKRFAESQALAERLADRALVDKAKARLIAEGLTEAEAHRQLQQVARRERVSVAEVARQVLRNG